MTQTLNGRSIGGQSEHRRRVCHSIIVSIGREAARCTGRRTWWRRSSMQRHVCQGFHPKTRRRNYAKSLRFDLIPFNMLQEHRRDLVAVDNFRQGPHLLVFR